MPYSMEDSKDILHELIDNLDFIVANDILIKVKSHPTMNLEYIKNLIGSDYSNNFSLVDESFIECLLQFKLK